MIEAASPTGSESDGATDESALVAAARTGDARAFEQLVERHADSVYRIVAGILGRSSLDESEDAAQEVFVRIHRGLPGFDGDSKLSTWIYRIATNVALARSKKRRSRPRSLSLDGVQRDPASSGDGPDQAILARERAEAVRRAVANLPDEQRAVVVLRAFEGLPFEDVARILGIPRPTCESRMARAKDRLREALGDRMP